MATAAMTVNALPPLPDIDEEVVDWLELHTVWGNVSRKGE